VSADLIDRYGKSIRLQFPDANRETRYRESQQQLGQDSSAVAFGVLLLLCAAFAYLEFRAFGLEMPIPKYGYLLAAVLALLNLLISRFSAEPQLPQLRLLGNGLLAMGTVIGAVYLQKYSAYHVIEFILLAVWLGAQKSLRMWVGLVSNLLLAVAFVAVMYLTDISGFWMTLVAVLLASAVALSSYIGYVNERARRMSFLQAEVNASMTRRQEQWSFALIDLEMALGGISDFRELIGLLKKHLESVIDFDSYILTSLEGQGPKPVPDKIEGELFEKDDKTLWPEELLGKLTQTRQATVSDEHEIVKGFLGMKKKRFISYRLDVPVFNDSSLMGIISMRRESQPFDELDMIAGASIASQAMLIFRRSGSTAARAGTGAARTAASPAARSATLSKVGSGSVTEMTPTRPESIIRPGRDRDPTHTSTDTISSEHKDMEMTDHSFTESDQTLVPKEVISRFKHEQQTVKKTVTLMSRENAEKIAIDRYRTAAVEGEPLSVLIIEVDGLSRMREEDGDEVAYKVFAAIVKYIFTKVDKEKDILGRYGQNGLSVLMPRVDMNAAERFAEMLRQYVESHRYRTAYGEKTATLSIGVAAITDDTGDYAAMIKRADMALFVAKKNGRNCVKVRL
jgi:diguanylate cyclase (GGDEF)-like protein